MTPFTYTAGDLVRVHGEKHPCKVRRINLDNTVDLIDGRTGGLRTVWSGRVGPPKPTDAWNLAATPAPARKAGTR